MSKEQFLNELEYLLQDLGEEAGDAVGYYRDYFEEAGPEREAEVLEELGSPERIAAIVRADIRGELDSGGGFTDRGYEDERFRDPGYQMVKRLDLPERTEGRSTSADGGESGGSHRRNMEGTVAHLTTSPTAEAAVPMEAAGHPVTRLKPEPMGARTRHPEPLDSPERIRHPEPPDFPARIRLPELPDYPALARRTTPPVLPAQNPAPVPILQTAGTNF